jgi:hypothetical protein
VRNYCAILSALVRCQAEGFLRQDRIVDLTLELLTAFVGDHQHPGYVLALLEKERDQALTLLREAGAPEMAAAHLYALLHPDSRWERVAFDWQPVLRPALELGIVRPGEGSEELVEDLVGRPGTPAQVGEHLERIATYMNDERWCQVVEEELELADVKLTWDRANRNYPLTLSVDGIRDPLRDTRLLTLVRRALAYRHPEGVVVKPATGDTVSFRQGGPAFALIGGTEFESHNVITLEHIGNLEMRGAGWADELTAVS